MELTTKGIKQIMAIARPAIIRLYGRQPLKLNSYKVDLIYANTTRRFCLVADGKDGNRFYVELVNNKEKVPEVTQVLKYEDIPDADAALAAENKRLREALQMVQSRINEQGTGVVSFTGEEWVQIDRALARSE